MPIKIIFTKSPQQRKRASVKKTQSRGVKRVHQGAKAIIIGGNGTNKRLQSKLVFTFAGMFRTKKVENFGVKSLSTFPEKKWEKGDISCFFWFFEDTNLIHFLRLSNKIHHYLCEDLIP